MIRDFSLDKNFWRRFTKAKWNRKPTVIRAPFRSPIVTSADVFRAVVTATRRLREPTDDFSFRLEKGRVVLDKDLDRWLPRAEDGSIKRYVSRVGRSAARRQFAIFVSDFQIELGWAFFSRLQQFLKGLYEIEGVPSGRAEVDLFMGNYRRTHTSVHRDSADVFCFVVDGRKRIRAWPGNAISSSSPVTGPSQYMRFLGQSICLEGKPGDIIYWPSSYWHVAESGGWFGSSLSLGLYYGSDLVQALAPGLEAGSREIFGNKHPIASLQFSNRRVPTRLVSVAERVGRESGTVTRALMCCWMQRITGYGFERIPRARGHVQLRAGKSIRAKGSSLILSRKDENHLLIAANGQSIIIPFHRDVENLIDTLNHGRPCPITDLLTPSRRGRLQSIRTVRRALKFLLNARALEYA
jgi:50S ribosomal protein L16 3-hydroxylase